MALSQATEPTASSTTSQAPPPPSQTQPILPPPQLFDILPALYEILARIDHTPPSADLISTEHHNDNEEHDIGANFTSLAPLEPKDLPAAILPLKAQIRRGLKELGNLPDMERSVQEQAEEIVELERKIGRQEEVLRGMGGMGRGLVERLGMTGE